MVRPQSPGHETTVLFLKKMTGRCLGEREHRASKRSLTLPWLPRSIQAYLPRGWVCVCVRKEKTVCLLSIISDNVRTYKLCKPQKLSNRISIALSLSTMFTQELLWKFTATKYPVDNISLLCYHAVLFMAPCPSNFQKVNFKFHLQAKKTIA